MTIPDDYINKKCKSKMIPCMCFNCDNNDVKFFRMLYSYGFQHIWAWLLKKQFEVLWAGGVVLVWFV